MLLIALAAGVAVGIVLGIAGHDKIKDLIGKIKTKLKIN